MLEKIRRSRRVKGASRQAGFSLVELLVSLVIMAEILIGLLIVFDSSARLAREQTHVAELQQSQRVAQAELIRFAKRAGHGGLPVTMLNLPTGQPNNTSPIYETFGTFPLSGYALALRNNVDPATIIGVVNPGASDQGDDDVLPGSDVLIVRGVLTTPMYYVDPPIDIENWVDTSTDVFAGQITLPERARTSGRSFWDYPQDIDELSDRLLDAKTDSEPVALIMRDTVNPNAYVIAAFDFANTTNADLTPEDCPNLDVHDDTDTSDIPDCIQFNILLDPDEAGYGSSYADLSTGTSLIAGESNRTTLTVSPGPPAVELELPTKIGSIGLLEEYRFFVRTEWEVPGDTTTRLTPVLSRASFFPGTDEMIDRVDIADNVLDLQISMAADADAIGTAGYGLITDENDDSDEILFNDPGDTVSASAPRNYTAPVGTPGAAQDTWYDTDLEFHYLRINTLVQGRFVDRDYVGPNLVEIEDQNRGTPFVVEGQTYALNSAEEKRFRRRWLQTVVEMRSLQ
ncbi:MAG: prepilin-type N-terminal cleavage/methylation domain-containing protein [Acidobacteriota bacterium]